MNQHEIIEMHEKRREAYADIRLFVKSNCKISYFRDLKNEVLT